jgi:tight adherence protein B
VPVVSVVLGGVFALGVLILLGSGTERQRSMSTAPRRGTSPLAQELARAGWAQVNPATAVLLWLLLSLVSAAVVSILIPIPILGVLAGVAVAFSGQFLIRSRVSRRERRLRQAWPGVVDHVRSAVRSGASVSEAVAIASSKVPEEVRDAFSAFVTDMESGHRVDKALASLKERVANPIADRIIESLRMAHEVGGHALPAVLDSLQASVRADIAVREDAIARQSWIRAASRLGAAAPWLVIIVLSGRPETISAYSSVTGSVILLAGALVTVLAYRMMSRLGRLPEDVRWCSG